MDKIRFAKESGVLPAVDSVIEFKGGNNFDVKCGNIKRSVCSRRKRGRIHLDGKMMYNQGY